MAHANRDDGDGAFAVPMFEAILQAGYIVPALVTRPVPPPTGRKKELLHPNPMRDFAAARGITIIAPETTSSPECRQQLQAWSLISSWYVILVKSYRQLLWPFHGWEALIYTLPYCPNIAGQRQSIGLFYVASKRQVSVIHMTPQLDGGPILTTERTPIGENETAAELEPRLAQLGIAPVLKAIDLLRDWDGQQNLGVLQNPTEVTSARRLRKSDGNIIWTRSAQRIRNQTRALKPWPGVFTHLLKPNSSPLRLLIDSVSLVPQESNTTQAPGCVVSASRQHAWIQTGDGIVALDRVQPAGKRVMPIAEFLQGHPLEVGIRFGDPPVT